jgi:hypothetical protein
MKIMKVMKGKNKILPDKKIDIPKIIDDAQKAKFPRGK